MNEVKKFYFETKDEETIFRDAILEMVDFCREKNQTKTISRYERIMNNLSKHGCILLTVECFIDIRRALNETLTGHIHSSVCQTILTKMQSL